MQKNIRSVLCAALWLAALCVCLGLADRATRRDDGERKYGPFFEEEQAFDVFFMGTSRVIDGVQPMELWRDYGVSSYNLGNNSECLDVTEQVLRLALEYHKPKAVLIDVYYVDREVDDAWTYSFRHLFLDEIPLSLSKFDAVRATLPRDKWMEFLIPFSLYHGRWEEMLSGTTERMIESEPFMKGSELRVDRQLPTEPFVRTQEMTEESLPGIDALRRIAALCRENGAEPVFMAIPAPIDAQEQMNVNSVQRVADELGVPFINMLGLGLVDFESDCYDYLGHLNPDGSSKVTAYLGQWIDTHFDFEDKRDNPAYADWNAALEEYEAYRDAVWGGMTRLD